MGLADDITGASGGCDRLGVFGVKEEETEGNRPGCRSYATQIQLNRLKMDIFVRALSAQCVCACVLSDFSGAL